METENDSDLLDSIIEKIDQFSKSSLNITKLDGNLVGQGFTLINVLEPLLKKNNRIGSLNRMNALSPQQRQNLIAAINNDELLFVTVSYLKGEISAADFKNCFCKN